jgi:outer membrane PBP1 activator LpoA protein
LREVQGVGPAAAYERAVAEDADFVIGPLAKSAVAAVAGLDSLEVPVLSLNYLPADAAAAPEGLYQFGLLPEDEARQAAEAAIQNGQRNAIALVPAGQWGGRMLEAFRERYQSLGGLLLEVSRYNSKASDYGRAIQRLLNLDSSYQRERLLQSRIGRDVRFEPRRRRDVDVIFMAAMPRQARLLEPQLEFHRAGDLPAYATSHVFAGSTDEEADWDLNGLYFTELPWILDNIEAPDGLYRQVVEYWPGARERHTRLYALGIDAFGLLPHLERLGRRDEVFNGQTGRLRLDEHAQIRRELRWARFVEGKPVSVPRPGAQPARDVELGSDVRERAGDS